MMSLALQLAAGSRATDSRTQAQRSGSARVGRGAGTLGARGAKKRRTRAPAGARGAAKFRGR